MHLELSFSKQEPLQRASVKVALVRQDLGDLAKAVANTDKRVRALEVVLLVMISPLPKRRTILYIFLKIDIDQQLE